MYPNVFNVNLGDVDINITVCDPKTKPDSVPEGTVKILFSKSGDVTSVFYTEGGIWVEADVLDVPASYAAVKQVSGEDKTLVYYTN